MIHINYKFRFLIIIVFSLFLTGCHSANQQLTTEYVATAEVNPDIRHNPAPIVITTYQLKAINTFKHADYFSLYDRAKVILGQDLLHQEQIEIKPSQKLVTTQHLLPQTQYIGVIAGYRDIDNSKWRVIFDLKKIKSHQIIIELQSEKIVIKPTLDS